MCLLAYLVTRGSACVLWGIDPHGNPRRVQDGCSFPRHSAAHGAFALCACNVASKTRVRENRGLEKGQPLIIPTLWQETEVNMIIIHREKSTVAQQCDKIRYHWRYDKMQNTEIWDDRVNITHSFNTADKTACNACRKITKQNKIIRNQKKQMVIKLRKRKIR